MIEITNLSKRFGELIAVDGVSFQVSRGSVLGFLGPNGAGKSTTMKMITGFIAPDAGTVTVGGDNISIYPVEVKRRIGYLPEGAPLYGDMTVKGFLGFVAEIRGYRGAQRSQCMDRAVELVSLGSVVDKPIETLSKGFKRRVGLAQAILHDPEVLILDEPTDGLDPNQKHDVRELIRSMAENKTIVLSTHILEEVEAVCNRAIIIAEGRIVSDGTPAELEARSTMHNAVSITLRGKAADGMRDDLAGLAGVRSVEMVDDAGERVRFHVFPKGEATIIEQVSAMVHERAWEIEELRVERGQLDEVFRRVTVGEDAPE
ncbi:MAG: ATP-binding cassette domain-containing protein [Gammaproteobacteria bacterium]|jgi:ABC-2 type transport system ATP-binding protein|nr:ATP-binding cassette domain-containing protein [Gammaproteobacteria bacterium]NCF83260.1 ATP-binding cassette domain-containing protein [Pseudomonadota bacterium]